MKTLMQKLKIAMTVFDILVILGVAGIAYFSIFSYYNIEIQKTEDYLKSFFLALKVAYYLGAIAFLHMFVAMVYTIIKKIKMQNEV